MQITAEQIVREAKEHQEEEFRAPKQKISDPEELAEYRLKKRKEFEDLIRRVRWNNAIWVKYAVWEEQQGDYPRARSVWERSLDVNYTNVSTWLKYAEMEMKAKQVNHARNVWDRAVSILPRIDQLWYKYIHMEEMLGNIAGARAVFERWMTWEPDHQVPNAPASRPLSHCCPPARVTVAVRRYRCKLLTAPQPTTTLHSTTVMRFCALAHARPCAG